MISEERLYKILGQRIRLYRLNTHMTQAELAQLVGLERTSITNIEKGTQKVPLHVFYKICDVFQIDVSAALPDIKEVREVSHEEWLAVGEQLRLPPQAAAAYSSVIFKLQK